MSHCIQNFLLFIFITLLKYFTGGSAEYSGFIWPADGVIFNREVAWSHYWKRQHLPANCNCYRKTQTPLTFKQLFYLPMSFASSLESVLESMESISEISFVGVRTTLTSHPGKSNTVDFWSPWNKLSFRSQDWVRKKITRDSKLA